MTPNLPACLTRSADVMAARQGEWVEHHLAIPCDHDALAAAELMRQAVARIEELEGLLRECHPLITVHGTYTGRRPEREALAAKIRAAIKT